MKYLSLKYFLLMSLCSALLISGCDKKAADALTENSADSIKKDSLPAVAENQLTGKSKMIAKLWKATEFETPNAKLSGDLIDIKFDFKADGSVTYSENGKKEIGKWKLNEQETIVMLEYGTMASELDIKELTEDKMVLAGKEHGMYRTYTLTSKK